MIRALIGCAVAAQLTCVFVFAYMLKVGFLVTGLILFQNKMVND